MKTKLLISFICVFAMLTSCKNNDDDTVETVTLHTSWTLTRVSGGLVGADDTFAYGMIVWHFDEDSATLTVENLNTDDQLFDILEHGTYSYSTNAIDDIEYLLVEGGAIGKINLSLNELIIDQDITIDGFLLEFERFAELIL